jgi:Zn-dependent protease with chaperone function
MTASDPPRAPVRVPSQIRVPSQNGPLFAMYALLTAALTCVGASAGGLLFSGDRSLSASFTATLDQCTLRFPVPDYMSELVAQRNQCWAGAYRAEGWFTLGAAAAVPLLSAGLIFVVPLIDRRRLARAGRWNDIPGATARFGGLCATAGLPPARRPELRVAGLRLRQAFTTARPGGRPLVVIPVKTALSHGDRQRFDPVLLHELAHVRARDVSWVSTVRGLALVTIPVLALATAPEVFGSQSLLVPSTFVIQACAFVACSLLLAAALLRYREIEADRQAVRWLGTPAPLHAALDPAARLTSAKASRWRGPLALHPSLAARITALRDPLGTHTSGFAYALATGAVTAMVMNTAYFIAWTFDNSQSGLLPARVSAGAGGLMLGLGLTPALLHRTARARAAGVPVSWWQPAAGAALGLFLGSLIPPGTALGAVVSLFLGQGLTGLAIAGVLACVGAGVVALTVGLASLATATATAAARVPGWLTASLTLVTSCFTAAVLFPVPGFNFSLTERFYLVFALPDDHWRWLALPYPVAAAVLTVRSRRWRLAAAATASLAGPLLAATVTAVLFFPHDHLTAGSPPASVTRITQEQWWVAVFAGLVVLIVLALGRGIPGLASASVSAWLTTLLVGVECAVYGSATGGSSNIGTLTALLVTPSVWLLYLAVPVSCLALVRGRAPAALTRQWTLPVAAFAGAACVAVAVLAAGLAGLIVPVAQPDQVPVYGSALPGTRQLIGTVTPSGALTSAAARMIIARVGEALPSDWTADSAAPSSPAPGSASAGPATVTPAACASLINDGFVNALPHPLTQAQGQYTILPGFFDGIDTLQVSVTSYASSGAARLLAATDRELRACPRYTITDSAGSVTATVHQVAVTGLPVPAWRAAAAESFRGVSEVTTWVELAIGHNLVVLKQTTGFPVPLAQPDEAAIDAAVYAITPGAPPPPEAGQALTQAAASQIADAPTSSLGSSWVAGRIPPAARAHVTYQPAECAAVTREGYLDTLPAPLVHAESQYLATDGLGAMTVRVESFAQPVPASLLTAASRIFAACPRYTTQTSGSKVGANGPTLNRAGAGAESLFGFPAWQGSSFIKQDQGSAVAIWIIIPDGHNLLLIDQTIFSQGSKAQPDFKAIGAAVAESVNTWVGTAV